jgi:hypothetical protein
MMVSSPPTISLAFVDATPSPVAPSVSYEAFPRPVGLLSDLAIIWIAYMWPTACGFLVYLAGSFGS